MPTFRKAITIAPAQVTGGPLTNFPLLFSTTDPDLRTTANGGQVANANGWDIVFATTSTCPDSATCGGNKLNYEIETYDPTTGQLVAWVRVPSMDNGTVLYLHYGDTAVAAPTETPAGVWDMSYRAVWHLKETPPAAVTDSTGNGNEGIHENSPTQAVGKIDGSLLFDGTLDRDVVVPSSASLQLPAAMTLSAWVSTSNTDGQARVILAKWTPGSANYWLGRLDAVWLAFGVDLGQVLQIPSVLVSDGNFHYIVAVADAPQLRLYVDGVLQGTAGYSGASQIGTSELRIGRSPDALLQDWDGGIDEVRISSTARSAGWIATEYRNQNDPSAFYSYGPWGADLGLQKVDDLDPVGLGSVLTYTLTVTNYGPSGATGVTLTDALPPGLSFESVTPTPACGYDGPTRTVTCSLGSLGQSLTASVTLKVRARAVGTFLNTATVQGTEDPGPGGNNTASCTTDVHILASDVRFFTVTSTSEQNVLEWVNPTADYVETEIRYSTGGYPKDASDGTLFYKGGVAGGQEKQTHNTGPGSNAVTYYYGAFVHRTSPLPDSRGRFVTGRPLDNMTGQVRWSFSTGATAVSPPTVGGAGVVAPSNDRILYAMERGALPPGGEWPANWWPIELGGVVQSRSPVVPISVLTANGVVYLGAQDGYVYAVDATRGSKAASLLWKTPSPVGSMVQAAPAGIFTDFNGAFDYLLVGTRNSTLDNTLFVLNPSTGAPLGPGFTNGGGAGLGIGIINAMAAVDYGPPPRVYFTSYRSRIGGSPNSLWCLELTGTSPFFQFKWALDLDDIDGSPVLRNGRVYVGSIRNGGTVFSIDAATGGDERSFPHGDGHVKGFVFPDRNSPTGDIYFATNNYVWGVTDDAGMLSNKFGSGISLGAGAKPSPVLFVPGSHYAYVGGSDGKLYEIDVATGMTSVPLVLGDGSAVVGAPSLDRVNDLVHVGTEAGIFYAVEAPFPVLMCVPAATCGSNVGAFCYLSNPALCGASCTCQPAGCPSGCCDGVGWDCSY